MHLTKYQFWRLIAIGSVVCFSTLLCLSTFALPYEYRTFYGWLLVPLMILMAASLIHQIRFPLDLRIYVVWVFIFSLMSMGYGYTALGFLILICAYFLGKQIRFFNSHRVQKIVVLSFVYAASFVFQFFRLRNFPDLLGRSMMELAVSISALFTMRLIIRHLFSRINNDILEEPEKENIGDYFQEYNFTQRDKEMLQEVLSGCKYEEIATNHNLSLSSVKKRLAFLYKVLGVTCQIDFIIKFSPKKA